MTPQEIGEYYLLAADVARRLQRNVRWVREKIQAGAFGKDVIEDAGDFLIPFSGYNAYVQAKRVFNDSGELKPIYARSPEDATRKLKGLRRGSPRV